MTGTATSPVQSSLPNNMSDTVLINSTEFSGIQAQLAVRKETNNIVK
jgi:hypothetical protein